MKLRNPLIAPSPFSPARRRLAGLLGTGSLLALSGCGGGGGGAPEPAPPAPSPAPAPPPAPVAAAGISLVAGAHGGPGALEGFGHLARLSQPGRLATAPSQAVYFVDNNIFVGRVSAEGVLEYLASFPDITPGGLAVDNQGRLYASATGTGVIYRLDESAQPPAFVALAGVAQPFPGGGFSDGAGTAARLRLPRTPVYDGQNHIYFVDSANRALRRMTLDGAVSTVAGQPANTTMVDGQGAGAGFADPTGLVRMPDGTFLVLDSNRWRRVTAEGVVTTLPNTVPAVDPYSLAAAGPDSVYGLLARAVVRMGLDGSVTTVAGDVAGGANEARGLTVLAGGDLVVSDARDYVIRRVAPASGQVVAVIGQAPQAGNVDGTGPDARFSEMGPSAMDAVGNLYVMDVARRNLRKVTPAGVVTTLFDNFPSQGALAVDAAGNFYGVRDRAIVKVTPAGVQSIFAGQPGVLGFADGPAADARFAQPQGLAFDAQGNLFVGDGPDIVSHGSFSFTATYTYGNTIRKITPAGVVSTFSGTSGRQFTHPSTPPADLSADYHSPSILATDAAGRVYVFDTRLGGIRRIPATGGAPTLLVQQAMHAMTVTPAGVVFYAHFLSNAQGQQVTLRRLEADGTSTIIAGQARPFRMGVRTGPLPGALNFVRGLAVAQDGAILAFSENSVLRIQPA